MLFLPLLRTNGSIYNGRLIAQFHIEFSSGVMVSLLFASASDFWIPVSTVKLACFVPRPIGKRPDTLITCLNCYRLRAHANDRNFERITWGNVSRATVAVARAAPNVLTARTFIAVGTQLLSEI